MLRDNLRVMLIRILNLSILSMIYLLKRPHVAIIIWIDVSLSSSSLIK